MSREIYTLEIEDFTDEPDDLGYRVTIHEHGETLSESEGLGDGVAGSLRLACIEALEQAGILK
jgi:hypothetical protein